MTAPARISQADIDRATKSVVATGLPARVVLDLEARKIEIIFGESAPVEKREEWSDDDV